MVMPILVGTDGHEKMSKSLGNYIAVTDAPSDMFGKVMRIPDELMRSYFELLTDVPPADIVRLADPGRSNPRESKEHLAKTIITQYHSAGAADAAAEEFRRVHGGRGGGGLPDEVPDVPLPADKLQDGKIVPLDLILACSFEKSRSEARRIVAERGIRLNGEVIEDPLTPIQVKAGDILQRGKRRFVRLTLS
jgi:tyrosyl-tRNA synthetase